MYKDRSEAGKELAAKLEKYRDQKIVVYALPRGGVILGVEIAKRLHAPLDLIVVRKIGHPFSPEYGIGAVAENGHSVLNEEEVVDIDKEYLKEESERQKREAQRRREVYLSGREPVVCEGKTAILVDDGIATGLTMEAAVKELKHRYPKKIVVAVPVTPSEVAEKFRREVDDFVALKIPKVFLGAIGSYYQSFPQVSDEEVVDLLKKAK